jgi:hypothetical protein
VAPEPIYQDQPKEGLFVKSELHGNSGIQQGILLFSVELGIGLLMRKEKCRITTV